MIYKEHTRNQKRMYRIHKQEEKIQEQELIIGSLQQRIDKAIEKVKDICFTLSGDKFYTKVILKDTESGKELLEILGGKENE